MKILVIEDNEPFALMLCCALREAGYDADSALSGKAGIKNSLTYLPDLILLDYELGDMSGYDAALGIRCMRATSGIPFILLSSLAGDPMLAEGFRRLPNCRGALAKTQPLDQIIAVVRKILHA